MDALLKKAKRMNKSNIIIAILLVIIAAGGYKFIIKGNIVESANKTDTRIAIGLTEGERNFVLGEMRALLGKIQRLTSFIANDDMDGFIKQAKELKDESSGETQQALIGKMPIAFKQMSFKIHGDFKQLYEDAVSQKDKQHSLKQVSDLMLNCVACHSAYRFEAIK